MNEPKLEIVEEFGGLAILSRKGNEAMIRRTFLKPYEITALRKHLNEGQGHQWCRYSGPGRGDCLHFVGVPETLDETTCDEYGIPHGWCDYCWLQYRFEHLNEGMVERWVWRDYIAFGECDPKDGFVRILVPAEQGE